MTVDTKGLAEIAREDGYVARGLAPCAIKGIVLGVLDCALRQVVRYKLSIKIDGCFTLYRQGAKIVIRPTKKWRVAE